MTLLHADWAKEPPVFTPEEFRVLILDDAKRLEISEELMEEYMMPLFQNKLSPAYLRAFARATGDRIMIRLQEFGKEYATVMSDEERELRRVLQLVLAIGICASCVRV